MDDFISREQATSIIQTWLKHSGYSEGERNMMRCTIQMLEELPPTQKTGKWLEKNCVYSEESHIEDWQSCCCSVCGHYDTRPYMYYFDEPNYCSYCGCRMEREEE